MTTSLKIGPIYTGTPCILVERHIEGMTRSEFVAAMMADLESAIGVFDTEIKPHLVEEWRVSQISGTIGNAIRYAEMKWKTEKRRQEYLESETLRITNKVANEGDNLFVLNRFRMNTGKGGDVSCTEVTPTTGEMVWGSIYDRMVECDVLNHISGWSFVFHKSTYPTIEFHYDAETIAAIAVADERLARSLSKYYGHGGYNGD